MAFHVTEVAWRPVGASAPPRGEGTCKGVRREAAKPWRSMVQHICTGAVAPA